MYRKKAPILRSLFVFRCANFLYVAGIMRRRDFLKNTVLTATGMLILPGLSRAASAGSFTEVQFLRPPAHCRPQVMWMWLNGHVTGYGITQDLEAMRAMGFGGAILFNVEAAVPRGPVDMGADAWRSLILFTLREAERLGLEITLHNSAGFSGTGGDFVQPHQGMQQLVWRTVPAVPRHSFQQVPQPFAKLGLYRDIAVIAFPEAPAPAVRQVLRNGVPDNAALLADNDPESALRFGKDDELVFVFQTPATFRSVTIWRKPEPPADVYNGPPDNPPTFQLDASSDGVHYTPVTSIRMPQLRKMNAPGAATFPAVHAQYFRLRTSVGTWLSGVEWHLHATVPNWPGKANFYQHMPAAAPDPDNGTGIPQDQVIDLTSRLQPDGSLPWDPPPGEWTILRIGHTPTGQLGASQPTAAVGLALDTFSRQAVDEWWAHMDGYLFDALKGMPAFKGIEIDSWEVGVQNWTARMPEHFLSHKQYDIRKWLPALTGRIIQDAQTTNAFLTDFRQVQATLVAKEYYAGFKAHCAEKGWHLWGEPYGDGMFDSLQIAEAMDVPMGEFWARYSPGSMNTVAVALSAGHVSGRPVIGAEAFTGLPETTRWTEYPYALKAQGDHFLAMGINQLVFHTMVHQPYKYGAPGFSMAHFGSHFDRTNTWTPFAAGWTNYLARTQYMLQQGHYAADFVFFKGEDPGAFIPDIDHVSPSKPTSYGADVIGPEALFRDIRIEDGRIVFPGGMSYRVMVVVPLERISLPVLQKLRKLVEAGMWLAVNQKPNASPGLQNDDAALQVEADMIWGDLDGISVKERSLGKGKVFRGQLLSDILRLPPDFDYTAPHRDAAIRFTHRRTADADIYFVCNRLRRHERITAEFRVKGKLPELWNAEDGTTTEAVLYEPTPHGIRMPMEFTPSGAWIVVFRRLLPGNGIQTLTLDGKEIAGTRRFTVPPATQYAHIRNTFTIAVWIKPDAVAMPGKGYVVYPPEGEDIAGKGFACAGIAAGQQMVRLCERTKGAAYFAKDVVTAQQPIEGWTHVTAVYRNGAPSLYINGQLAGSAPPGEHTVLPGVRTKPSGELYSSVFEGNLTTPELYTEALTEERIQALFTEGLPAPGLPRGMSLQKQGARLEALVWQNGTYQFGETRIHADKCLAQPITGAWTVRFQEGRGAPAQIRLRQLASLHRHPNAGVRHFAGIATYEKRITVPSAMLQNDHSAFLHLGRVEVLAQVEVNGKDAGTCWKEPYMLDVSGFLRPGANTIRIRVATLWPNRQAGDENLPPENEYTPSRYLARLPDWFMEDRPSPGRRISFATWNNYRPGDPLLEAGLLGPVRLLNAWKWRGDRK